MTSARYDISGHYAGGVTRLLAHIVDGAVAAFLIVIGLAIWDYALSSIAGVEYTSDSASPVRIVVMGLWAFLYWWASIAITGKTFGKALLGLRVLNRDGDILSSGRAALRALSLPLSYLVFGIGFLGVVLGRERRALHDMIAGSVVVYDWGERPAELPTPISAYLSRRAGEGAEVTGVGSITD